MRERERNRDRQGEGERLGQERVGRQKEKKDKF